MQDHCLIAIALEPNTYFCALMWCTLRVEKKMKKLAYNLEISKDRLKNIIYAIGWAEVLQVFFAFSFLLSKGASDLCLRWRTYFCDGSKLQRLFMRLGDPDVLFRLTKEELNWRDTAVFVCYSKTLPLAATEGYGLHVLSHTYTHRPGYKLGRFFLAILVPTSKWHTWCKNNLKCVWCLIFPHFF